MPPRSLTIEPFSPDDLEAAVVLSAAVGWPHRRQDWALLLGLGQGLAARDGEDLAGTVMWWLLGRNWATLGLVIVAPELQGRGLGRRLMEAALVAIGERRVMLNGTRAGLPLYRALGFAPVGEVRQHQGVAKPRAAGAASVGPRDLRAGDLGALIALDGRASGLPRGPVLRALAGVGEALVLEGEAGPEGYAMLRRFGRGRLVGPVVAPDAAAARTLIEAAATHVGEGFLRIDVPAESGLSDCLDCHGLAAVDEVVTMVRGTPPVLDPGGPRVFALASQALG